MKQEEEQKDVKEIERNKIEVMKLLDTCLLIGGTPYHTHTSDAYKAETATIKYLKDAPKDVRKHFNIGEEGYSFKELCTFEYHLNNYGFRAEEDFHLDNEPNEAWCFGCSYTYGFGIPLRHTWPYLLQKKISLKVKNFGVAGGGGETTWRLIKNWVKQSKYKPKHIYILGFHHPRFEVLNYLRNGGYKWHQINPLRFHGSWLEEMPLEKWGHSDVENHGSEIVMNGLRQTMKEKYEQIQDEELPQEIPMIQDFLDKQEIKYSMIHQDVLFDWQFEKYLEDPHLPLDLGRDVEVLKAMKKLISHGYSESLHNGLGAHPGLQWQKEVVKMFTDPDYKSPHRAINHYYRRKGLPHLPSVKRRIGHLHSRNEDAHRKNMEKEALHTLKPHEIAYFVEGKWSP
jgi:hypothetical protein